MKRVMSGALRMRVRTLLILGLIIREAFSFWTGHPFDFEIWVRVGYWVARGVSPYAPLMSAPGLSFANDFGYGLNPAIGYLPFWPLLLAGIYDIFSVVGGGDRFVYYFMIKQPIILADVFLAFLLYLYVRRQNPAMAKKVMVLWLFSPFTIIISALWGAFDSIAMFFTLLALLAPAGEVRSAWDGVAAFAKSIPVLFIFPLSYSRGKKKLTNFLIALGIPVVVSAVVIYLERWPVSGQHYTVTSTLGNTLHVYSFPLSLWGTFLFLNSLNVVSNSTVLSVFAWGGYLWIPAAVIASLLAYRWFGFDTERGVIQSMLVILLTFLLVRGQVNEQYSIYLLALLLIDVGIWNPKRMRLFYAVSAVILAATLTNNVLLIRFLSPIDPNALQLEGSIISATGPLRMDGLYVEGLVFCGLNLWYLAALIRERRGAQQRPVDGASPADDPSAPTAVVGGGGSSSDGSDPDAARTPS